ncbi:MAG: nitroreductase [Rhizobiales bacterium]|nr:nitroreductase [Hyphomicrobiales bacterium]
MRDLPAPQPVDVMAAAVEHAVRTRRAIRAFRADPVDIGLIERILSAARYAPSGSNIQPWSVHVVTGAVLERLGGELTETFLSGQAERADFAYYPTTWRAPYLDRRRKTGWSLYQLAGVERGDRAGGERQRARNYSFFGAPVGLVFAIDDDLNQGSWLDYGMFIQSVMVLARAHGLHTCPLAAIGNYPDVVRRHLGIAPGQIVVAGMAMGHADQDAPTNRLMTEREPVAAFTTFHGTSEPIRADAAS